MTRGNRKEKEEHDNISPALFIRSFIQRICLEHLSWIPNEGFEQRNNMTALEKNHNGSYRGEAGC